MSVQTIRLDTSSRIRLVNQSVTGPAGADGAGVSVATKEAGTEKVAVTTSLDFLAGFDVAGSAGTASVSLDLTEYTGGALPLAGGGTGATTAADARTALGLGTAAVAAATDFATAAHNHTGVYEAVGVAAALVDDLSGVSNAATARTNLGLGTAAVAATGDFATAAQGTLAGTAVQPARTISTTAPLTGGGDLSANRTLAVSAASDTAAGVVELATDAETLTGTATDRAVTPANVAATYQKLEQAVNAQTGTTYTLVAADKGKLVTLSNGSAVTLTLPQDSDATIAVGSYVDLMALGAGQVTVVAGTGATLRTSGLTAKSRAQYARLGVQKISANTWSLFGDLAAS